MLGQCNLHSLILVGVNNKYDTIWKKQEQQEELLDW
mgnify:CR=1 FL=1